MKDYYKILEVTLTATPDEIKRAYRRLALKYHPDRNQGDLVSENRFKELTEAYEILSDIEKKKIYDYNFSYKRETPSASNFEPYKNEKVKEQPLTPLIVFEEIKKTKKIVIDLGRHKINQMELFKSLRRLLNDDNIRVLLTFNNNDALNKIIDEVLYFGNYLENYEITVIGTQLIKLAASDSQTISKIKKFVKAHRKKEYLDENLDTFVVTGLIIIVLIAAIFISKSGGTISPPQPGSSNSSNTGINIKPASPSVPLYSDWEKVNMNSGSTPECFDFKPRYDNTIDNKLQVNVGSNTDVVIKLVNYETDKCIRYIYIKSGTIYSITHIPEGRYYTKIAYGTDWRQKTVNGECVGKFVRGELYKKGENILDFNKVFNGVTRIGNNVVNNFSIRSFTLTLDVIASDFDSKRFNTNNITEGEFNK